MVDLTTLISNGVTNLPQVGTGIDGLNDVVIGGTNTLAADQVLYYNGTNWINDDGSLFTVAALTATSVLTPLSRSTGGELVPITVGTTAPSSPSIGDLWVDTN